MASPTVESPPSEPSLFHDSALNKLASDDQTLLLDTVDNLRSYGVSKYIRLPQIIVCGDQSSGKSSVLEAISRIAFPRGNGVCTTFPTELALRRGPSRTVKVQLVPSPSRPESEKAKLASYRPQAGELDDLEPLVRGAKDHLRGSVSEDRDADSFFKDTLHIEVTDPAWPPLSLVDLPGLISSPNPAQRHEDVGIVTDMVSKYMENPKSIILAVVSASYDLPLQKVFSLIKKYDPEGNRTMCVVTKPDNAVAWTQDVPQFVAYAKNKLQGYSFKLGWHIVKNRDSNSQDQTADERDEAEKDFFAQASWTGDLQRDQLGINKLRDRLSTLLEQHTRAEMPGVLKEVNEMLKDTRDQLSKLGPARSSTNAQRLHLTAISQNFENLVRQAVNGHYDDYSFFLSDSTDADPRKLRAAIQNLNEDFAKHMHYRGHAKRIINDLFDQPPEWPKGKTEFQAVGESGLPDTITRKTFISQIKSLSRKNRGKELIGSPNLRLVRELFLSQSRPWRPLATRHLESVLECVNSHLSLVSKNVAAKETAAAIWRGVIYNAMDDRRERVMEKLEELLKPHEKGHPITYDFSYIASHRSSVKNDVHARLEERQRLDSSTNGAEHSTPPLGYSIDQVMRALKQDDGEPDEVECSELLYCMQAYYDRALRTFIDNIAVLAIEGCIMDSLEDVFSPIQVVKMDEKALRTLGGESEQAQAKRLELEGKLKALQDAQRECSRAGSFQEHPPPTRFPSIQITNESLPPKPHDSTSPPTERRSSSSSTEVTGVEPFSTPNKTATQSPSSTPAVERSDSDNSDAGSELSFDSTTSATEQSNVPAAPRGTTKETATQPPSRTAAVNPFGSNSSNAGSGHPSPSTSASRQSNASQSLFGNASMTVNPGFGGFSGSLNAGSGLSPGSSTSATGQSNAPGWGFGSSSSSGASGASRARSKKSKAPQISFGTDIFSSKFPKDKKLDALINFDNVRDEPYSDMCLQHQVLPLFISGLMSFEELHLMHDSLSSTSTEEGQLCVEYNHDRPSGTWIRPMVCKRLLTMEED